MAVGAVRRVLDQTGFRADFQFQLLRQLFVFLQILGRLAHALAELNVSIRKPRATLLDQAELLAQLDELSLISDALAINNIKLGFLEGCRHFVLHDFDDRLVADLLLGLFDRANALDFHAH